MSIKKTITSLPSEILAAKGLFYQDWEALTPCQRECNTRLGMTIQLEQEAYLYNHPEIRASLEILISKMARAVKRRDILKECGDFFLQPFDDLDQEIRERLGVPSDGPYTLENKPPFKYVDSRLESDLQKISMKYFPRNIWQYETPEVPTPDTESSSFISIRTSATTLPTPEPLPTPDPTLSETMFTWISNTVDKAVYTHVDDQALRYDTAYVELSKAVEEAMEIPVIEIRQEIAALLYNAYNLFQLNIMEKERIAAEIAWEKRMRKKMKRTLRRQANFKGYETPQTPKSQVSSHESYRIPPPKPCICHPQFHYNRYAKDRFGIYLPRDVDYSDKNITATPVLSVESDEGDEPVDDVDDAMSLFSSKSVVSGKSAGAKSTISGKSGKNAAIKPTPSEENVAGKRVASEKGANVKSVVIAKTNEK